MRCAMCGSRKVFIDEKKEGYSITKGIIGTALFGTGGAAMGVNGKANIYYHCSECGQTLSYLMPESIEKAINDAIKNPEVYTTFLKSQKKTYPNIEWNEHTDNNTETAKKEWYDYTSEEKAKIIWDFYQKNRIAYIEESELFKLLGFEDGFIDTQTMNIFEQKGLMTKELKNDKTYYTFYENAEDIKNNINEYEKTQQTKSQIDKIWEENKEKIKKNVIKILDKIVEENPDCEIEKDIFKEKIKIMLKDEIKEVDYEVLCGYDELIKKLVSKIYLLFYKMNYITTITDKENYLKIILADKERKSYLEMQNSLYLENVYGESLNEIKKLLNKKGKMTIVEMQKESSLLSKYSQQKISGIINQSKEFEKIIEKKRTYYAIIDTKPIAKMEKN